MIGIHPVYKLTSPLLNERSKPKVIFSGEHLNRKQHLNIRIAVSKVSGGVLGFALGFFFFPLQLIKIHLTSTASAAQHNSKTVFSWRRKNHSTRLADTYLIIPPCSEDEMNAPCGTDILPIHGFASTAAYDQQVSSTNSDSPSCTMWLSLLIVLLFPFYQVLGDLQGCHAAGLDPKGSSQALYLTQERPVGRGAK